MTQRVELYGPGMETPHATLDIGNSFLVSTAPELDVDRQGDAIRLRVRERPRFPRGQYADNHVGDVPVGNVPLVLDDGGAAPRRLEWLSLPPPANLGSDDVGSMWRELRNLPPGPREGLRRSALWKTGELGGFSAVNVHLPSLVEHLNQTLHCLNNWPMQEASERVWRPVGHAGGSEDVLLTTKRVRETAVARSASGRALPLRSLRAIGAAQEWQLHSVAHLAAEVLERVRAHPDLANSDLDELLSPLEEFADRARPPQGAGPDLAPASWPSALRHWHRSALDVLAQAENRDSTGNEMAPLCRAHELYEAWVTSQVLGQLAALLPGVPELHQYTGNFGKPTWVARWQTKSRTIECWAQPSIGSRWVKGGPKRLCEVSALSGTGGAMQSQVAGLNGAAHGFLTWSRTSDLQPDLLLAVSDGSTRAVTVIDAKFATSATSGAKPSIQLLVAEATATGSKYLWGLRKGIPGQFVGEIAAVHIVSNAPTSAMFEPVESRIFSHEARPSLSLASSLDLAPVVL